MSVTQGLYYKFYGKIRKVRNTRKKKDKESKMEEAENNKAILFQSDKSTIGKKRFQTFYWNIFLIVSNKFIIGVFAVRGGILLKTSSIGST